MLRRTSVSGIDTQCDSCNKTIPAGTVHLRVRAPKRTPRTRREAMMINRIPVKYISRHVDCPAPLKTIECPYCEAGIGENCFTDRIKSKRMSATHPSRRRAYRRAQHI